MQCVKLGCRKSVLPGSNYCDSHQPSLESQSGKKAAAKKATAKKVARKTAKRKR